MNDLVGKLNELTIRTHAMVDELELNVLPTQGFQFSATAIGGASGSFFYLSVEVETRDGIRVVIGRRYHDGPTGSEKFDVDGVMKDLTTTLSALSEESSNGERREQVLEAVEEAFAQARAEGLPCRMTALLQRPLRIGDTDGKVAFEILSTMLRDDLTRGGFSTTVRNAADFASILDDEIYPEQRERSTRLREKAPPTLR